MATATPTATPQAEPRRPGRPRQTPLAAPAATAQPDGEAAEAPAKRKPGRPLGSRNKTPHKVQADASAPARSRPRGKASIAAPTEQSEAAQAQPTTDTPSDGAAQAGEAASEGRGRNLRLVDRFDQWMRENPGPKTREQLIDVAIANAWLSGADAGRVFAMCMNREKRLFTRMPDGNTEIYLRRAELAPPSTPGKVIRRAGSPKTGA